jgi:hypothetical protein
MFVPSIDFDTPLADFSPTFESLEDRVTSALQSLMDVGHLPTPTEQDRKVGRAAMMGNSVSDEELSRPEVIVHIAAMLDEYDKTVVKSAAQMRTYVTNKLILETENPDPRIRLKSLELLGKISDVGLFTDKTEITLRHRPTEELEQMLRERLTKVIEGEVFEANDTQQSTARLDLSEITDVEPREEADENSL